MITCSLFDYLSIVRCVNNVITCLLFDYLSIVRCVNICLLSGDARLAASPPQQQVPPAYYQTLPRQRFVIMCYMVDVRHFYTSSNLTFVVKSNDNLLLITVLLSVCEY